MKSGDNERGAAASSLAALVLASTLAMLASPSSASEETVLEWRDTEKVIGTAVTYHYQKAVERNVIESACYFDPKVATTMRCSANWGGGGMDSHRMKNRVKRLATKWCKKAGGRKCVLFWRNGRLRFDGLSSEQTERLEAVVDKIPDYNSEASPLPEGVGVSTEFRDRFPELRDYGEGVRAKNKGRNSHYALCTNEKGPWAWFHAQGGGVHSSIVRDMCVLKCTAFSEYLSKEGECYVVYENGNFVNSAAQQAVMQ